MSEVTQETVTRSEFEALKKSFEKMEKSIKRGGNGEAKEKKERVKKEPNAYNIFIREEAKKEEYKDLKPVERFKLCSVAWQKRKAELAAQAEAST